MLRDETSKCCIFRPTALYHCMMIIIITIIIIIIITGINKQVNK